MDAIRIITGGANVCRDILHDLPEWFGSPEAKEVYYCIKEAAINLRRRLGCDVAICITYYADFHKSQDNHYSELLL